MERSSYPRSASSGQSVAKVGYVRMDPDLKAWAEQEAARRGQSFNLFMEGLVRAERARASSPDYESVIDRLGGQHG